VLNGPVRNFTKIADGFAAQGWKCALPQEDVNAPFPHSLQKPVATDHCDDLPVCYTNHFHRMRFAGFADEEPQSTGITDSGSGFCAIGFKFWVNEYNHYTVAYANTLLTAGTWLPNH
jgi:hypothetical protein